MTGSPQIRMRRLLCAALFLAANWLGTSMAGMLRYADTQIDFFAPSNSTPNDGFRDPQAAVGQPDTGHMLTAPIDNESVIVSLGNGGSITLGFDRPVQNQPSSARNPHGYDLLVWGNAFISGIATSTTRFMEPGIVEVAFDDGASEMLTWRLILPRRFISGSAEDFLPSELDDTTRGNAEALFDGFADVTPMSGAQLAVFLDSGELADLILDDPMTPTVEGLGGTGMALERAVAQLSPGVPILDQDGQPQFVIVNQINRIRISDALAGDMLTPATLGFVSSEVDGVIVLPNMVPEPTGAVMLLIGMTLLRRTSRR